MSLDAWLEGPITRATPNLEDGYDAYVESYWQQIQADFDAGGHDCATIEEFIVNCDELETWEDWLAGELDKLADFDEEARALSRDPDARI